MLRCVSLCYYSTMCINMDLIVLLLSSCLYLARITVRTELAKAEWRLQASQQRQHVQMLDSPPVE